MHSTSDLIKFTHTRKYDKFFPELIRKDGEDGLRWYSEDSKLWVPSMTTVISNANEGKFDDWVKREGKEKTDAIKKIATERGTKLHKVIEEYLKNEDITQLDEYHNTMVKWMFNSVKFYLDTRIDMIACQETRMISRKFKLAGTVDLIANIDNELAVADYKNSYREKPEEWLEDYFVQLAGYFLMFSELTGVVPKKLVVILMTQQNEIQIVERRNIRKYAMKLYEYTKKFYADHPQ